MSEDRKVTLEMLRKESAEAREEAIEKQALPDGNLKEACIQILMEAVKDLRQRAYGEVTIIRMSGLSGMQVYTVGNKTLNLKCLPGIKEIRRVLAEIPELVEEKCDKYSDTQILVRFA